MFDDIRDFLSAHYFQGLLLMLTGGLVGWALGYWRRHKLKRQVVGGDIRELLTVEQILLREQPDGRATLRIRSLGSAPLHTVLTNPLAHDTFLKRAAATTTKNTLIAMHDQMGSYLLHLLQPWVCGLAQNGPFKHDVWLMAPVCEPNQLSNYQSTTVVLVRRDDLERFLNWDWCRRLHVEHGSDGARVLTLWQMAREHQKQSAEMARLKDEGKRTRFVETMYVLDLGLDMEECPLPTRPIPWDRYAPVLKELGLGT